MTAASLTGKWPGVSREHSGASQAVVARVPRSSRIAGMVAAPCKKRSPNKQDEDHDNDPMHIAN